MTACFGLASAGAAVPNSVIWSDSFESYVAGLPLQGTNGWTSSIAAAGVVTNPASVLVKLTNTFGTVHAYPLPSASHTNVALVTDVLQNDVHSASGGVAVLDFTLMPTWSDENPQDETNLQYAFYIKTNQHVVIWCRSLSPATNIWLDLAASPLVNTGVWTRFTIVQDYSNRMFQIRVNEGEPISDAAGYTARGASPNGPWFHMVQTNSLMARVTFGDGGINYVDDVVVSTRALNWSAGGFQESVTNNGTIDNSSPLLVDLQFDTFTGADGDDLVANGKLTVESGLPSGLAVVARRVSATQVSITLTNSALQHESADTSSSLTFRFNQDAFTLGQMMDVSGYRRNDLTVMFLDTPRLTYSRILFAEALANDGTINNGIPLSITLAHDTFFGAFGEDFATNNTKLQLMGLPGGLTGRVVKVSATELQMTLQGKAVAHGNSADTNFTLAFQDGAFTTVPVSSSVINHTTNLQVGFFSSFPALVYASTTFTEVTANNGAIHNTVVITLADDAFSAGPFVAGIHYTVTNVPAGLTAQLVRDSASQVTVHLAGNATLHTAGQSTGAMLLTFRDAAFATVAAADLPGSTTNFTVTFQNAPSLAFSRETFAEFSLGTIDNQTPVLITLTGDDFAASLAGLFSVTNLPAGLALAVTRESATQVSVRLTGAATAHALANSISDLTLTFLQGAFVSADANQVVNFQKNDLRVAFMDDTSWVNAVPYEEPFESYPNGFLLAGANGWTTDYYADAAEVTNDVAINEKLAIYFRRGALPITADHTRTLFVRDSIQSEIHSPTGQLVYLDLMMYPSPVIETPPGETNLQYALYINTNCQVVIWHRNTTGGTPTNEWLTLGSAMLIDTSNWSRFTVTQDYTNHMYQLRVNEGSAIVDPAGWSQGGLSRTGSWFHMVQTNDMMSRVILDGSGTAYLDDVTVRTSLALGFGKGTGSVYFIR